MATASVYSDPAGNEFVFLQGTPDFFLTMRAGLHVVRRQELVPVDGGMGFEAPHVFAETGNRLFGRVALLAGPKFNEGMAGECKP